MDVAKYLGRLRTVAANSAIGALKRGPTSEGDPGHYLGWHCGFQAGLQQAEQTLIGMLDEESEEESQR